MNPNKQKTDWENNFKFFCNKEQTEILVHPTEIIDFISKILQQQKTEIIKVISKHRPVFFKGDLHSLLSKDEVMKVREVLRIEILEELGVDCKEIRERLKQIK